MKRFKNILVACDDEQIDETLLRRAIWPAKGNDAEVTLAYVLDSPPGEISQLFERFQSMKSGDVEADLLGFHENRLTEYSETIRSAGVPAQIAVNQGIPFVELIRMVLRHDYDMVIKSAAGELETKSLFFSSTDLHRMRKCPCPVWIMKGHEKEKYERIMAAVDPGPDDQQYTTLNTLILDLSSSLSNMDGGELSVVNAWRLENETAFRNSAFARIPKERLEELIQEAQAESESRFRRLTNGYSFPAANYAPHHIKGAPREAIPKFAREHAVDLIVMGTLGRTSVRGLIIGNTAEAILNQVSCSVIAVKPPGFETTVTLNGG